MAENTKSTKDAPKVEAPKADAKLSKAIADERSALESSVTAVTALESRTLGDLIVAYRAVGTHVIALAKLIVRAETGTAPVSTAVDAWPKVRAIVWPKTPANGVMVGGRSESVVQRGVKVALYVPDAGTVTAWESARTTVTAKAKAPKASTSAKDAAKHTAYTDGGLKGLTAWGEAKATKRIARDGSIASGSNRNVSGAAKERAGKVEDAADAFATAIDVTADADERDAAREAIVVGSITVAQITALSLDQLKILGAFVSKAITAKAKAPKVPAVVAPVLTVVPPVDEGVDVPAVDPLAGISDDTKAKAIALLAAAGLISA